MGEEDKLKMEEKLKEKEMSTEDDIDKPELTALSKFCNRHGINANLIMLKITLFVMYGGNEHVEHFLFAYFVCCSCCCRCFFLHSLSNPFIWPH